MSDSDPKVSAIRAPAGCTHLARLAAAKEWESRTLTAAWSKASVKEQEKETLAQPVDSFFIIQ